MWASDMFIHEMRLESIPSLYIVELSLPPFLLGLEASWQIFVSHSFSLSPTSFCSLWIVSQLVG